MRTIIFIVRDEHRNKKQFTTWLFLVHKDIYLITGLYLNLNNCIGCFVSYETIIQRDGVFLSPCWISNKTVLVIAGVIRVKIQRSEKLRKWKKYLKT